MSKANLSLKQTQTPASPGKSRWQIVTALGLAALFGGLLSGCDSTGVLVTPTQVSSAEADYAITSVTVIDAINGTRTNQTVLVRGDRIESVQSDAVAFTASKTISGEGKYLIPGLWDMHVHITYEPEITEAMPELFLKYGITSVRDTGGLLQNLLPEIKRWRAPGARAPRIFFSGPLLDGSTVVYDGGIVPEIGTANVSPEMAVANIERLKASGVDFVKTYELITPEVFKALTGAARKAGLPIASHVPLMMAAREAGPLVDSMEHLRNIELDCAANAEELLAIRQSAIANPDGAPGIKLRGGIHADQRPKAIGNYSQAACDKVIASLANTIQVPTLRLNTSALYQPYDRPDWQQAVAELPTASQQKWLNTAREWSEKRASLPTQDGEFSLSLVGQLYAAGVPLGAGTDTPIGSALPGYSLHTELERLVEAGLSPLAALEAATIAPARFVRKEDEMGQIKQGFVADLVLLDEDPLEAITNTRTIRQVISKGTPVLQN